MRQSRRLSIPITSPPSARHCQAGFSMPYRQKLLPEPEWLVPEEPE